MTNIQLSDGESIIGSWSVYIGAQGVNTGKITGNLHVTESNLYFESTLALDENAAAQVSLRIQAFEATSQLLKIPLAEIADLRIIKKLLILKSLQITLRSGEQMLFHFGAMSPQKVCAAISARTGLVTA